MFQRDTFIKTRQSIPVALHILLPWLTAMGIHPRLVKCQATSPQRVECEIYPSSQRYYKIFIFPGSGQISATCYRWDGLGYDAVSLGRGLSTVAAALRAELPLMDLPVT